MSDPLRMHVTGRMRAAFLRVKQQTDVEQRNDDYRELQQICQQQVNNKQTKQNQGKEQVDGERMARSLSDALTPLFAFDPSCRLRTRPADAATPALITIAQLQTLSRLYRGTFTGASAPTPAASSSPLTSAAASADDPGRGWVHELAQGSRPYQPPTPRNRPPRDPMFLKFLEEQRWKQERRDYHQLVKDLPGNKNLDPINSQDTVKGASRDIGHGLNILTLMATGFVVFYYAGSNLFPHNQVMPVMCGLLGLVGALMIEVSLFLVREQKAVLEAEQHQKMDAQAKKIKKAKEAERIRRGQIELEMQRRKGKLEQAQKEEPIAEENKLD